MIGLIRFIDKHIAELRAAGATGLDRYETRLRNNAQNVEKLNNLFYEACVPCKGGCAAN
jgi:hypothetical protein